MDTSCTIKAVIETASGNKRVKRRRFDTENLSIHQIQSWLLGTSNGTSLSRILWRDEEDDPIDIVNDSDLRECIRSHMQRDVALLRLWVTLVKNKASLETTMGGSITCPSKPESIDENIIKKSQKCSDSSLVVDAQQQCTPKSAAPRLESQITKMPNNNQKKVSKVHNCKTDIYRFAPGTTVRIYGLRVKTAYNNRVGVVVGMGKNGRVNVRVGATVCALRRDNIAPVTRQNQPKSEFGFGASIVLHGLVSRPELNGVQGIVIKPLQSNGRTLVHVNGRKLAIKPKNLRKVDSLYGVQPQHNPYVLMPFRLFQRCCAR